MSQETLYKAIKAIFSVKTDKPLILTAHMALLDAGLLQDETNDLDLKTIYTVINAYQDANKA